MGKRGPLAVFVSALALAVGAGFASGTPSRTERGQKSVALDEATAIVEVNATEGDAGIQLFLDGEPWRSMKVTGPDGEDVGTLLRIETKGRLKGHGLTEWFTESSEPPFEELPLKEFKKLFPEGRYAFRGETIEGKPITGAARLSHDIPNGPEIIAPTEGQLVDRNGLVASWSPGTQPADVEIVAYRAIFEREDPFRMLSIDLPAAVTSVTVPAEFLEPNTEYLFELQAIEASGNITFSELHFMVSGI